MKKKIADRWVRALRSGKFKQAKRTLETSYGTNCCLGVLCNLAVSSKVCVKDDTQFDGEDAVLPDSVQEWAGMKSDCGIRKNRKSLVQYNDDCGYSFNKIAAIIEKNYKEF